jgi:hypothetical protein
MANANPQSASSTNPVTPLASVYIGAVIFLAWAVTASALLEWRTENVPRFMALILLALPTAAIKAQVPGLTGTYSASFIFILAAIPALTLPEMVAIAAVTAVVQNLWHTRTRVQPVQLMFNMSNLILSTALAHGSYTLLRTSTSGVPVDALLGFVTVIYWALNTGVLSIVLALVNEGEFIELWQRWCLYSLPFHLGGGAVAILIAPPVHQGDWRAAALFAPVIFFVAKYYRTALAESARK